MPRPSVTSTLSFHHTHIVTLCTTANFRRNATNLQPTPESSSSSERVVAAQRQPEVVAAAMAVSLLCKDCNTLLRNVAEAQAHNEATGHANFEESTQPVSRSRAREAVDSVQACAAAATL